MVSGLGTLEKFKWRSSQSIHHNFEPFSVAPVMGQEKILASVLIFAPCSTAFLPVQCFRVCVLCACVLCIRRVVQRGWEIKNKL